LVPRLSRTFNPFRSGKKSSVLRHRSYVLPFYDFGVSPHSQVLRSHHARSLRRFSRGGQSVAFFLSSFASGDTSSSVRLPVTRPVLSFQTIFKSDESVIPDFFFLGSTFRTPSLPPFDSFALTHCLFYRCRVRFFFPLRSPFPCPCRFIVLPQVSSPCFILENPSARPARSLFHRFPLASSIPQLPFFRYQSPE